MNLYLRDEFKKIIYLFLGWRIVLTAIALLSAEFLPLSSTERFLGGGWNLYSLAPSFFGWANFDGEHYLSIAIFGYKALEQAFFPLYPSIISIFVKPDVNNLAPAFYLSTLTGLVVSNLSFALSLLVLWRLVRLDYSAKTAYWSVILLTIFPTSFYFGAVYSESLYLILIVSAFYLSRKQKWWLAAALGVLASLTRVFGLLLLPALLFEAWEQKAKIRNYLPILLIPLGTVIYMVIQWRTVGDPLAFYHLQLIVGEQHQSGIVLLPQVIYRYIKMLWLVNLSNPIYQTLILEIFCALLFVLLFVIGYLKKVRWSYLVYFAAAFLLPTIQGSFSSTPRYILTIFPGFIIMAILVAGFPKKFKLWLTIVLLALLLLETSLFLRGYWVA